MSEICWRSSDGVKSFFNIFLGHGRICSEVITIKGVRLRWSWWILEVVLDGSGIILMGLGKTGKGTGIDCL
jgi:hypothetical protein